MAVVTYGALITELSGSIGGTTFQKNPSGNIARMRPYTPVNPSVLQSARQLLLIQLVAKWSTLSLANKTLWNALATAHNKINDWGNYAKLSGYQWFLAYNLICATQGEALQDWPQAYVLVDPVPQFTLIADNVGLYMNWVPTASFPGYWAGIYATTPMRQTSIKLRKSTFLIKVWNTTNTALLDITEWYEGAFNINWTDFYASAQAAIIVRMKNFAEDTGYASPFTSNIIMIG